MTYHYPLSDFFGPRGSGGGKGGGGGGGKKGGGESDPNTLRSRARARMIEAISEGQIVGLVDENGNELGAEGERAIFFDQTPIKNADGTYNFKNVLWQFHRGLADEGHFNGMDAVETPYQVEVRVQKNVGPVQRTIVDENADAIRAIVRIPSLVRNDTENGGLKKTSVSYAFEVRGNQGTWTRVLENHLRDQKATSAFQVAHEIQLPAGGSPWDVRMVRLTDDSEEDELQNETYWEGYIVLVKGKFTYPHTAKFGGEVNAEDMGSSIPPRAYRVKGLIVNVPSNYDPIARTYSGIWDGTFKFAWTNNPAWVFYDLLVNDRYGLGEFVTPAIIDKWSLYTIAQYCDQPVRSGYKNADTGADIWEPRFTFNGVLNRRDDAYFVLQQISTAWRGMAYWSLGQIFATADMPADPVRIVTPANVIDGEFNYSGTALKARHSVVIVKWNDPNDFYRPATEIVINQEMLNKFGWREKRLQLTGCTSRGLAHRYGKWILDTERNETETVEYQASWDHVEVRPGDIVQVAHPRKAMVRLGGRIVDALGSSSAAALDYASGLYTLNGFAQPQSAANVSVLPLQPLWVDMPNLLTDPWQIVATGGASGSQTETGLALSAVGSGSRVDATYALPTVIGRQYRFKGRATGTNFGITVGATKGSSLLANLNQTGVFEAVFTATSTTTWLGFFKTANAGGNIVELEARESVAYEADVTLLNGNRETVNLNVASGAGWTIPASYGAANARSITVRATNTVRNTVSQVELDYDFEPIEGQTYFLTVTMPDGALEKKQIARFEGRTVYLAEPLTDQPKPNAMFVITGDVQARQYRILSVEETEPNIFKITGLFHDPQKFARIEQDVVFDPIPYSRDRNGVQPPTNLSVREIGYVSNGASFHSLHLSWTPPSDFLNRGFVVSVETPTEGMKLLGQTMNPWFEMQNTAAGQYKFMVQTIGFSGLISTAAEFTFEAAGPNGFARPTVTNLRITDNPTGDTFKGSDLGIEWTNNFAISSDPTSTGGVPQNVPSPHYTFNTVKVFNNATGALLRSARVTGQSYVYTLSMNAADNAAAALEHPCRSLRVEVTVHDVFGRTSAVTSRIFTNPRPSVVTPTVGVSGPNIYLSYPPISDLDFAGLMVWRKTSPGINVATEQPYYDGTANPITIMGADHTNYWFVVAAYDRFGKADLNYSGEFMATTGKFGIDEVPPARPTGLALSTEVEVVDGVAARLLLRATLDAAPEDDFAYFDFEIREENGNYVSFTSSSNTFEWTVMPERAYTVRVRAVDATGNPSFATSVETIVTPAVPELADVINAGSVAIEANKVRISGETTLFDWRRGGDETKIDGGAISANTIDANKLTIGQRGIQIDGIEFEHNSPDQDKLSWTDGSISYIDNAGATQRVDVSAGGFAWTGGVVYIYWVQGAPTLSHTNVLATAMAANAITLATYRGGSDLVANYGRTVIEGSRIKTGSVLAEQIGAKAIGTEHLKAGIINTSELFVEGVIIDDLIADGAMSLISASFTAGAINVGTGGAVCQTAIVAPKGGRIAIDANFSIGDLSGSSSQSVTIALLRNGTTIFSKTESISQSRTFTATGVSQQLGVSVSGSVNMSFGSHSHNVSGSTNTAGGVGDFHSHTVSGSTSNVTISGSTPVNLSGQTTLPAPSFSTGEVYLKHSSGSFASFIDTPVDDQPHVYELRLTLNSGSAVILNRFLRVMNLKK